MRISDWSSDVCSSDLTTASVSSSGRTVSSAISRSATTGFLSRSRSTVSSAPPEICRARWPASSTRSNRLETLSMQSSTVTRATSELQTHQFRERAAARTMARESQFPGGSSAGPLAPLRSNAYSREKIGSASWWERGCQYVEISVGDVSLKNKENREKKH